MISNFNSPYRKIFRKCSFYSFSGVEMSFPSKANAICVREYALTQSNKPGQCVLFVRKLGKKKFQTVWQLIIIAILAVSL